MSRAGLPLLLLCLASCSIQPVPVVAPLAARTWDLSAADWDALRSAALETAPAHGYQVSEQPAGLLLQSSEIYGHEIDEYCVYPIINSKTGGRMHTFASWQMEMNRSLQYSGRATGVLVIEIAKTGPLRAKSYCRAFTELNIQPAESKGVHERELVQALGGHEAAVPTPAAGRVEFVETPPPSGEGPEPGAAVTAPAPAPAQQEGEEGTEPTRAAREPCDLDAELRKLDRLRTDGLLTEQEFQEQKQRLLARCG